MKAYLAGISILFRVACLFVLLALAHKLFVFLFASVFSAFSEGLHSDIPGILAIIALILIVPFFAEDILRAAGLRLLSSKEKENYQSEVVQRKNLELQQESKIEQGGAGQPTARSELK